MTLQTFAIYFLIWVLGLITIYFAARLCCRAWMRTVAELEQKRKDEANGPNRD